MTRANTASPMCFISVGMTDVLMPVEKGLKLVALLQSAVECDRRYELRGYAYMPSIEPLRVEFALVNADQLRAPKPPGKTIPSGPLLLESGQ